MKIHVTDGPAPAVPFDADAFLADIRAGRVVRVGNVDHQALGGEFHMECAVCGWHASYRTDAISQARFVDEWGPLLRRHEHGKGAA